MIFVKELRSVVTNAFIFANDHSTISQMNPLKALSLNRYTQGEPDKLMPYACEIHPTSACQLQCPCCSYENRNSTADSLSDDAMHKMHRFVRDNGVKSIIYSGGGDPLAWKGDFERYLLFDDGSFKTIATNGIGMKKILNPACVKRLNIVQMSIRGHDRTSFSAASCTSNPSVFDMVDDNTRTLFSLRSKHNKGLQLTAKITINKANHRFLREMFGYCDSMGFDMIVVKLAANFENEQDVELNTEEYARVKDDVAYLRDKFGYRFVVDTTTMSPEDRIGYVPEKCWTVEYKTNILFRSNGDVFLCTVSPCSDENAIGNVNEREIADIWNGPRHHDIIAKLSGDMVACGCRNAICRHYRYNYFIEMYRGMSRQPYLM